MFDEIKRYKNNGHFFFKKGDKLKEVCKDVPNLPGVYYFLLLSKGNVELVYIGKSGAICQSGDLKKQSIRGRIKNTRGVMNPQKYFDSKIKDKNIDGLDESNNDLPGYVEGLLMQRYFEIHGSLPLWNKHF